VILQHDPLLKGAFRYNIFAEQTDVVKPLWRRKNSPAFNDMDMNYLKTTHRTTDGRRSQTKMPGRWHCHFKKPSIFPRTVCFLFTLRL